MLTQGGVFSPLPRAERIGSWQPDVANTSTFFFIMILKKDFISREKAGSRESNEPRLVGSIVKDMLQGWNRNTDLAVDLKTLLRSDTYMKTGKEYLGVLRRDQDASIEDFRCRDAHYTFVETLPQSAGKRNPHVFCGKYITVTRRDDGSLRPNFKPMPKGMSVDTYALGVAYEIRLALNGLIEEE